ncbi:hypothetical protein Tco_0865229 [Tanacetum coccineum]
MERQALVMLRGVLSMSKEPVGRTQKPIVEEVKTQEPIVKDVRTWVPILEKVILEEYVSSWEDFEHGNGYDDESAPIDGHFSYDVQRIINTAYESQYGLVKMKSHVDVHLFDISIDVSFDNIRVINLVLDDILEGENVDVINTDGFESEPGNDDETSSYMRRRLTELSREEKWKVL